MSGEELAKNIFRAFQSNVTESNVIAEDANAEAAMADGAEQEPKESFIAKKGNMFMANVIGLALIGLLGPAQAYALQEKALSRLGLTEENQKTLILLHDRISAVEIARKLKSKEVIL